MLHYCENVLHGLLFAVLDPPAEYIAIDENLMYFVYADLVISNLVVLSQFVLYRADFRGGGFCVCFFGLLRESISHTDNRQF